MFCSKCGNEIRQGEQVCSECGAATAPFNTPMQQTVYYVPAGTSIGGWVGWWLLCIFLPIIGWILTICITKDQSVKNAMIANLIVGMTIIAASIILAVLGIFSTVSMLR